MKKGALCALAFLIYFSSNIAVAEEGSSSNNAVDIDCSSSKIETVEECSLSNNAVDIDCSSSNIEATEECSLSNNAVDIDRSSSKIEAAKHCFSLNADYLYWHAVQTNMSYGLVVDNLITFNELSVLNQSTDFNSAFRLGVLYHPSCLWWDARFSWTRFHNTTSGSTSQPIIVANQLLAPNINFVVGGGDIGGPASSKWRLRLDMFDLNFSFPLCLCHSCRISPYIGLRGEIINQTELIKYIDFLNTDTANRVNAIVTQINNFSGVGPKAGFEGVYCVGCGLSLVGDFSMAAAYGDFYSRDYTDMEEVGFTNRHASTGSFLACSSISALTGHAVFATVTPFL